MDTLNSASLLPQLVVFRGDANLAQSQPAATDLPLSLEMLSLFEAITGWVVEFEKSPSSQRRSVLGQSAAVTIKGSFNIVDMSAEWPTNRPTASRIKCDRFLKLFSDFVMRSQVLEDELKRSQEFLAEQNDSNNDSFGDSFAPRHLYLTQLELHSDFELDTELDAGAPRSRKSEDCKNKTESKFRTGTVETLAPIPQWQIGGQRGIHENRYIDWSIRNDHRIELIVGKIESPDLGDIQPNEEWEMKLIINPETSRYWFSTEPRGCYWLLDHSTRRLSKISDFSKVSQLHANQTLVVTTADLDTSASIELNLEGQPSLCQNADDLASAIQDHLGTDEPLLVLLRQ